MPVVTTRAGLEPLDAKPTCCAHCGGAFESKRKAASNGGRWIRCCSRSCARLLEISKGSHAFQVKPRYGRLLSDDERKRRDFERGEQARRKRRARLAGVARGSYTTASIAERDEGTCGLCGEPVDMTLKWPDLGCATVDHVLPISRGGDDTLSNVQLAHFGCNVGKNNRI